MAMIVTTSSLPNAEVGTPYSVTLAETGGVAPITWTLKTGTLPTGLTLDGSTGIVSGTPTTPVSATPLIFEATDSTPVTPQVADSSGLTLTVNTALAVATSSLPSAKVGVAYSATLTATGGVAPLTWSITAGALPTGLSLAASTGVISGTPTAQAPPATFTVTDSASPTPATASATPTLPQSAGGQVTPNIPVGNASLSSALITPGWPMASVPASNPIAGAPGTSPEPNSVDATLIQEALVQSGNTSNRVV